MLSKLYRIAVKTYKLSDRVLNPILNTIDGHLLRSRNVVEDSMAPILYFYVLQTFELTHYCCNINTPSISDHTANPETRYNEKEEKCFQDELPLVLLESFGHVLPFHNLNTQLSTYSYTLLSTP